MKIYLIAYLATSVAVTVGCSRAPSSCVANSNLENLKSLNETHANADADLALSKGDRRLLGVYGPALEVPGLDSDPGKYSFGVRSLDGTTDVICNEEQKKMNDNAWNYAKKYNQEILSNKHDG